MHANVNLDKTNTDPVAQNDLSTRMSDANFDLFPMLVIDLMHEFEQGVWKNLFTHLVRILHALDPALVIEMDKRYSLLIRVINF